MAVQRIHVVGNEMQSVLEDMLRRAKEGTLHCTALRVFKADGTFEDVVLGGTEEERAQVLADLRDNKNMH